MYLYILYQSSVIYLSSTHLLIIIYLSSISHLTIYIIYLSIYLCCALLNKEEELVSTDHLSKHMLKQLLKRNRIILDLR